MKRDAILTCDQAYVSQLNLQHGTTANIGEQED